MVRIAGVVVLYNPREDVLGSIGSYISQIEVLFAVDNSEHPDPAVTDRIRNAGNVVYLWNGGNAGIAAALNIGASGYSPRATSMRTMRSRRSRLVRRKFSWRSRRERS